ncbi:MAG: inositol monophosphatase family protein, partial [Pseudomonadota bacterium]
MVRDVNPADVWSVAEALADAARDAVLPYFRSRDLVTQSKGDTFDPVTAADRAAETAMRAVVRDRRPEDSILGEEFPDVEGHSGWTWVLDPIDGTRGFVAGTPT